MKTWNLYQCNDWHVFIYYIILINFQEINHCLKCFDSPNPGNDVEHKFIDNNIFLMKTFDLISCNDWHVWILGHNFMIFHPIFVRDV